MAACRRVQRVLLLIFLSSWICYAYGGKSQNADNVNVLDNVDRGKNQAGEGKAAAVDAASASIRRSGAWKLAEEAACREDVIRICPKHSWNNNLAVLECLQDRKDVRKHGRLSLSFKVHVCTLVFQSVGKNKRMITSLYRLLSACY